MEEIPYVVRRTLCDADSFSRVLCVLPIAETVNASSISIAALSGDTLKD